MTEITRIFVIDTNVLISYALAYYSSSGQAVKLAFERGRVVYSEKTLYELVTKLLHRKFDRYLDKYERFLFIQKFVSQAEKVEVTVDITACRDPKDDKFLSLAVASQAELIMTGDKDLLVLHPFAQHITILTPTDFLISCTTS